MEKILTYLFGNKIKIVTATNLRSYMEFEQKFLFNGSQDEGVIKDFLWNQKRYSIEKIKTFRSKKIDAPKKECWLEYSKEKVIRWYD